MDSSPTASPNNTVAGFGPHRAQIVMRGVRFETNVPVLTTYCTTFAVFFDKVREEQQKLGRLPDSGTLRELLASSVQGVSNRNADGSPNGTTRAPPVRKVECTHVDNLPAPAPASPTSSEMWLFDFTLRKDEPLPVGVEWSDELSPEFAGAVFVYLRRLYAQSLQDESLPKRQIVCSARWHEMPFDQQRSLSDVVVALGVTPLLNIGYDCPTAQPAAEGDTAADGGTNHHAGSMHDDLLEMPAVSCVKCGVSGHSGEECKY